jgi:hypothetical protein
MSDTMTPAGFDASRVGILRLVPAERGGAHVDMEPGCDILLLFPSRARHDVRPVCCPDGEFVRAPFAIRRHQQAGSIDRVRAIGRSPPPSRRSIRPLARVSPTSAVH